MTKLFWNITALLGETVFLRREHRGSPGSCCRSGRRWWPEIPLSPSVVIWPGGWVKNEQTLHNNWHFYFFCPKWIVTTYIPVYISTPWEFNIIFSNRIHFSTRMFTHPSAIRGLRCFTSVILRKLVFPTWFIEKAVVIISPTFALSKELKKCLSHVPNIFLDNFFLDNLSPINILVRYRYRYRVSEILPLPWQCILLSVGNPRGPCASSRAVPAPGHLLSCQSTVWGNKMWAQDMSKRSVFWIRMDPGFFADTDPDYKNPDPSVFALV